MATGPGTLELLARELARALQPLAEELEDGGIDTLLARLGLPAPQGLSDLPQLTGPASATGAAAAALGPLIPQLTEAIAADDVGQILNTGATLAGKVIDLVAAIEALAAGVHAAGDVLGGLSQQDRAAIAAFATTLPRRLLDYLVISYLAGRAPAVVDGLELAGLVDRTPEPGAPTPPSQIADGHDELHLERLADLIAHPAAYAQSVYGLGAAGFDGRELLPRVWRFLAGQGLESVLLEAPGVPPILEAYVVALRTDASTSPPSLVVDLRFPGADSFDLTYPLRDPWSLHVTANGQFSADVKARVTGSGKLELIPPSGTVQASLAAGVVGERAGGRVLLLGLIGGTRLDAQRVELRLGFTATSTGPGGLATGEPTVSAELQGGKLAIGLGGSDSFLARFLPQRVESTADLSADWSPSKGLVLRGGTALAATLPLAVEIGPARLDRLDLGLRLDGGALALDLRLTGGLALGPFSAVVDGVGAGAEIAFRKGNLGPADLRFAFLPPKGLGLSIDTGPVKGAGFILFDQAKGRYAGVFQVSVGAIGVTAIGLLDTKLPKGAKGFALLVVLRGEFPPIQLGFGFALTAVGGLLALNRRVDVDALRARFASGTVGRILAPEDPVRNAPVLLADLGAVFPPVDGVVVVGPTLQIKWVNIVRFDLGIFVELPGPTKIVLLGSAKAEIANPAGGKPLLRLRLDIIGLLDLAREVLEFDAVLIDSQLLGVLEISGGVAFRLSWGDEPYVVLTIGGFHPAYSPAPLVFPPSLTRVAMTRGHPKDFIYFRFEGYFAITTNTLQFGASIDVAVNAGPLSARGHLGFDALIRFKPFFFQFDFHASFKIAFEGFTLAGVSIDGILSGPGPVTFSGRFCIEILFFDICWKGSFSIGKEAPKEIKPVASAVAKLADELDDPENLEATGGTDRWVVVEPGTAELPMPIVPPLGQVIWSQKRAPLDLLLQRFETVPLQTPEFVTATGPKVVGKAKDWFAPGGFANLSNSQSLNRRAFERLDSGIRIGTSGIADGPVWTHEVTVDVFRLPENVPATFGFLLPPWLLVVLEHRVGVFTPAPVSGQISVTDELWEVRGADGLVVVTGISQAQAHQLVLAGVGVAALPATDHLSSLPL